MRGRQWDGRQGGPGLDTAAEPGQPGPVPEAVTRAVCFPRHGLFDHIMFGISVPQE